MSNADLRDRSVGDRYKFLDLLGEGAMGAVYLANDTKLPRQVAMKVLRKEWVMQPNVKRRLENECGLMARLGPHTHIVTLYDRLEHDGNVILVMEFVPDETLADITDRTRTLNADFESSRKTTPVAAGASVMVLETRDAIELTCQCLDALDFAHNNGILHRDIKPSNIMVMRDHNGNLIAKVMDFGIGKALSGVDDAVTSPMLTAVGGPGPGTPAYMAPEQIDPNRFGSVGRGADLYAMGITLYELLTLTRPFEGTYTELLHAHTSIVPPDLRTRNPKLPREFQPILAKALKKKIDERYQSAADFRMDLMAARPGGGTVFAGAAPAPTSTPVSVSPKRAKGKMIAAAACGLLIVVAVAVTALVILNGRPKSDPANPTETSTSSSVPPPSPHNSKITVHAPAHLLALKSLEPQSVTQGEPYQLVLELADASVENPDTLAFSLLNKPDIPGADFDPKTRTFSLDGSATPVGSYTARFQVVDTNDATRTATEEIVISVQPAQIILQDMPAQVVRENETTSWDVHAIGPSFTGLLYTPAKIVRRGW